MQSNMVNEQCECGFEFQVSASDYDAGTWDVPEHDHLKCYAEQTREQLEELRDELHSLYITAGRLIASLDNPANALDDLSLLDDQIASRSTRPMFELSSHVDLIPHFYRAVREYKKRQE